MSTVPGMYVICHQIHQKNLLGPNPTCNSTGSKVTFGKRTSAELSHPSLAAPIEPRDPNSAKVHSLSWAACHPCAFIEMHLMRSPSSRMQVQCYPLVITVT